ncbi:Pre-mRNA-splicing factor 38A, partial [Eschrichtius robustus]|nr:Pre-mRNA-splicing factor 38A [Eschrichtius robustus]
MEYSEVQSVVTKGSNAQSSLSKHIDANEKRYVLEEAEQLEPRVSALEEDMDDVESSEEEEEEDEKLERVPSPDHRRRSYRDLDKPRRSPTLRYRRSRSRSPRRRSRSPKRRSPSPRRERHRSKSPRRHRSRSRDRRHRSRSKSPGIAFGPFAIGCLKEM